jgi:hypothetical protein
MMSSMFFETLGFTWLLYGVFWILPAAYIVLRWRAYRENTPPDPQLGIKTALHYFKTLGYHVMLIGAFCLLYGLFESHVRGQMVRLAIGLLIGGGIVFGSHAVILDKYTNPSQSPAVPKLFNGFNLVISGLVGMGALIATLVLLLQKYNSGSMITPAICLLLVYGLSWGLQTVFLFRATS